MAETPSNMVPLGTTLPPFSLPDAEGNFFTFNQQSKGFLVIFICNHCPYVVHIAHTLNTVQSQCHDLGIEMVCINANDITAYPADAPKEMVRTANVYGWSFPYLFDETQEVATTYSAACTPDVFLFDANQRLYYRGQFDDSRPNCGISTGKDLLNALNALAAGKNPPKNQKPAVGCNIKWKT
ncbi:MAG: thioredoxin family protein [Phycisphaerales bacterium]|jgi:peroxiredoxin|nr:thioredoxin family protein [Phycisphaerales bacterium]